MIHVRKSFTTSSCCMKLRSEDDTCRKQWTQGCRTQGTFGRALSSPGPIVVPNGQQRLFLTPIEESAVSDTSGSLLSALRARHCYLKFSVTVATVTLNGAMRKINLANNLANKAAIQKICTAHETLQFQNQRESSGCGVVVLSRITNAVPEIHVGHSKFIACWNDI